MDEDVGNVSGDPSGGASGSAQEYDRNDSHRDQWFITRDAPNARKIARSATF
jgi:hypothetical protein